MKSKSLLGQLTVFVLVLSQCLCLAAQDDGQNEGGNGNGLLPDSFGDVIITYAELKMTGENKGAAAATAAVIYQDKPTTEGSMGVTSDVENGTDFVEGESKTFQHDEDFVRDGLSASALFDPIMTVAGEKKVAFGAVVPEIGEDFCELFVPDGGKLINLMAYKNPVGPPNDAFGIYVENPSAAKMTVHLERKPSPLVSTGNWQEFGTIKVNPRTSIWKVDGTLMDPFEVLLVRAYYLEGGVKQYSNGIVLYTPEPELPATPGGGGSDF